MELLSYTEYLNESKNSKLEENQIINEGGAFGHMSHPYDDTNLTFEEIKDIMTSALSGSLNKEVIATEKLDGQAIAISWKDDELVAARNKGHYKNGAETALTVQGVIDKFAGRGALSDGFSFAIQDLETAIRKIPAKDREDIFKNGRAFMHLEVIYPPSTNVINYDAPTLTFHSATEYDAKGNAVGESKSDATKLQKLIKGVNADLQKHFNIKPPMIINMPKVIDFEKEESRYLKQIDKIVKNYNLNYNNTIGDYITEGWVEFIRRKFSASELSINNMEKLIQRWAFFDNSFSINHMKKEIENPNVLEWAKQFSKKDFKDTNKDIIKPIEELFLSIGVTVLKNASGFLAVNPDKVVQDIRNQIINLEKELIKTKNLEVLHKLKIQMARLNAIGGFDAIVPSEGVVFQYNGKTYKLTGAFASVNQILGTIKYSM